MTGLAPLPANPAVRNECALRFTQLVEVSGAPPGKTPPPNARVKVIILPKKGRDGQEAESEKQPSVELKTDTGKN